MFQVTHSQRLSDSPLNVWVAVQEDGQVLTAHCTCMAGLGECCSHVAATLFYMEKVARIANGKTCTSLPCSWLKPAASNTYKEISKIDFTSPARKRKNTDPTTTTSADETFPKTARQPRNPEQPSKEETTNFYEQLYKTGARCTVLTVVEEYADKFIPESSVADLPPTLNTLFKNEYMSLNQSSLQVKCQEIFQSIKVTEKQVQCSASERYFLTFIILFYEIVPYSLICHLYYLYSEHPLRSSYQEAE